MVERFGGDMQMKDIAEPEITAPNQILLRVKVSNDKANYCKPR